ncbi:ABC transporter substrate-binding protein [Microbacterium sp. MYb62]|uniref:ABC transporter substrate-binding protein n=1 Tax=Microbacterium sp. MYb62 TaxID=1848690 RepID=UPI000CFC7702|nr:ABC transporter substrate-binding protein [Microbacterium sp. MYb62]PRB15984.1 ABC transporter substrate-binding protein [Microbacterium sp. MYb62]
MRKHTRARMMTAGATGVLASLVLAGCGAAEPTTNEDGQTVLTVYGWKGTEGEPANVAEINAAFEKAHPEIELVFEALPANEPYSQRVQPELLAGDSADVVMVDSNLLANWGESGYLADLSDRAWADTITDSLRPFAEHDGELLAMPMEAVGVGMFANTQLLQEVGITETPGDWPAFLDALQALQDAGHTPIALPNRNGWTGSVAFLGAGASVVPESWDAEFFAGDATFEDWRPAVEQLVELGELGYVDWRTELGVDEWSDGLNQYTQGDIGFWVQGSWNLAPVREAGVPTEFVAWPGAAAGETSNGLVFAGTMWAMNAATEVEDAAQKYIDFWAQPENLKPFLEAESAVSPFVGGETPANEDTAGFVAAYEAGDARFMQTNTWMAGDVQTQIGSRLQALFLGDITVDELLDELDSIAHTE